MNGLHERLSLVETIGRFRTRERGCLPPPLGHANGPKPYIWCCAEKAARNQHPELLQPPPGSAIACVAGNAVTATVPVSRASANAVRRIIRLTGDGRPRWWLQQLRVLI